MSQIQATKVALCQIRSLVGDFDFNIQQILKFARDAKRQGAHIAVFPELCLTGYPPYDLLCRADFQDLGAQALSRLISLLQTDASNLPELVIVGAPTTNQAAGAERCFKPFNSALVIETKTGQFLAQHHKCFLPDYDIFDESRYFSAGASITSFRFNNQNFLLSICEDLWAPTQPVNEYSQSISPATSESPPTLLYPSGPKTWSMGLTAAPDAIILNLSSSPFAVGKQARREAAARYFRRPVFYVNHVGAVDSVVFDGSSFVMRADGCIAASAPVFEESVLVADTTSPPEPVVAHTAAESALLAQALECGLREYFKRTGFTKAVLGLSGGIDSAVVATIATRVLGPQNVIGLAMPSAFSSAGSVIDAEALAKNLGLVLHIHPIKFVFKSILLELDPLLNPTSEERVFGLAEENLQARLRGLYVMTAANKLNALALATGNKSELSVGYTTIYGDMVGAMAPIGDVFKTQVYALAEYYNEILGEVIPQSTITKPPSAELRPNQKDSDSLPEYPVLDQILRYYFEYGLSAAQLVKKGFDSSVVQKVLTLIHRSEFKRAQAPFVIRISNKAFGIGRRVASATTLHQK